jgi:hypothetical protein
LHRGGNGVNVNPAHDTVLLSGDTVLVMAPMECLVELEAANHPQEATTPPLASP